MAQIFYQILSGTPDFSVSLSPLVVPSQIRDALGTYFFDSAPEGIYTVTIIDGHHCIRSIQTTTVGYTTTTTTRYIGCDLIGQTERAICTLIGNAIITNPSPCQRPGRLTNFSIVKEYTITSTGSTTDTSGHPSATCEGVELMNSFPGEYIDTTFNRINIQAFDIQEGFSVYLANGSMNCVFPPDGWYFTEQSAVSNMIFQIVNGVITQVISCTCILEGTFEISTTTTTSTCCPIGYVTLSNGCELVETSAATPPEVLTFIEKTSFTTYSTYGTLIFDSGWNLNGTGTYTKISISNPWWINEAANTTEGPMNRTSIWVGTPIDNQEVGFAIVIDAPIAKTYYIGVGCDNYSVIKLNGNTILNQDYIELSTMLGPLGGVSDDSCPFIFWYIYPIEFQEGTNSLQILGHNITGPAGFGVQVYDATPIQLTAVTSQLELAPYLLFTSDNNVGNPVYIGTDAYTCADPSYNVGVDETDTPICIKITRFNCGEAPPITSTTTTTTTCIIDIEILTDFPITTTTTTTLCLDMNLSVGCSPGSQEIFLDTITCGSAPYYTASVTFATEAEALANTTWLLNTGITYGVSNYVTRWCIVKDSLGVKKTKSIYVNCPTTTTTTSRIPTTTTTSTTMTPDTQSMYTAMSVDGTYYSFIGKTYSEFVTELMTVKSKLPLTPALNGYYYTISSYTLGGTVKSSGINASTGYYIEPTLTNVYHVTNGVIDDIFTFASTGY